MSALPIADTNQPALQPAQPRTQLFQVEDKLGLIKAAPIVVDWLGRCARASGGRYDIRHLGEDHFDWWLLADESALAIAVTEVIEHPSGERWLSLLFAAGRSGHLWPPHLEDFKRAAAERGCVGVECLVRKGFAPKLIAQGMREISRFLEVRI